MPNRNMLRKIAALPIRDVLQQLIVESKNDPLPLVTLQARGGHVVTGHLIDVAFGDKNIAVLQETDGDRVWFQQIPDIQAICVHNALDYAPKLSDGAVDPAELAEPVAPLVIDRRLKEFSDKLAEVFGSKIDATVDWETIERENKVALAGLNMMIDVIERTFLTLGSEEFSRETVGRKIEAITCQAGPRDLCLQGSQLIVKIDFNAGEGGRYSDHEMAAALNLML